jgi:hypothetical protein
MKRRRYTFMKEKAKPRAIGGRKATGPEALRKRNRQPKSNNSKRKQIRTAGLPLKRQSGFFILNKGIVSRVRHFSQN